MQGSQKAALSRARVASSAASKSHGWYEVDNIWFIGYGLRKILKVDKVSGVEFETAEVRGTEYPKDKEGLPEGPLAPSVETLTSSANNGLTASLACNKGNTYLISGDWSYEEMSYFLAGVLPTPFNWMNDHFLSLEYKWAFLKCRYGRLIYVPLVEGEPIGKTLPNTGISKQGAKWSEKGANLYICSTKMIPSTVMMDWQGEMNKKKGGLVNSIPPEPVDYDMYSEFDEPTSGIDEELEGGISLLVKRSESSSKRKAKKRKMDDDSDYQEEGQLKKSARLSPNHEFAQAKKERPQRKATQKAATQDEEPIVISSGDESPAVLNAPKKTEGDSGSATRPSTPFPVTGLTKDAVRTLAGDFSENFNSSLVISCDNSDANDNDMDACDWTNLQSDQSFHFTFI
ncbi:hypothetical protein NP233_g4608 [Leucocoprinus birnbaumii]|uniref:Uncharacterized protein n=1 Tax=Leucocoprinus birnbaumii TaxID=56174 RepID=A0AAD5VUE5_9AGAR|nr:hypothetical protein NP233_g4608 [Leucocoprinus birnbaumii]